MATEYHKKVTLPVPTANLTDFPVCIKIVADTGIGAVCREDGFDVHFKAANGVTELSFERESFSVAAGAATGIFWVKTSVSMAGTFIFCCYGANTVDISDAEAAWDADFKAVYHMNDATTSTILDSTANNNDGAKKGANEPIEAAGKIWKGQDFEPTDDYVDVGSGCNVIIGTNDFTLEAWVYQHTTLVGWRSVFGAENGGASFGTFGTGGLLRLTKTNVADGPFSTVAVTLNAWTHVSVVFDSTLTSNNVFFYINGALVTTATFNTDFTAGVKNRTLGEYGIYGTGFFDGIIDEARISLIQRSADWIAYEYANMNPADGGLTWGAQEIKNVTGSMFTGLWSGV